MRRARKTSRRSPRSSGFARSFIPDDLQGEQDDPGGDGSVGNIEGGPMVTAGIEFEEIDNVAVSQSIVKVAEGAAENQAQGNLQEPVSNRTSNAVSDDRKGCKGSKGRQQHGLGRRGNGVENSEGHTGISD